MIYLVLSIICSLTVGVLLKLAKRYHIDLLQSITWNYLSAIILSLIFFKPSVTDLSLNNVKPLYIFLGFFLPSLFIIMGLAVQKSGLVRSDIAQRLSLFISFGAAFIIFNESLTSLKVLGMTLGIMAILFTLYKPQGPKIDNKNWIYPLLVFIGYGIVDISFKWISSSGLETGIPYTTALLIIFLLAFLTSFIYMIIRIQQKKASFQLIHLLCGLILGVFNFGNILFYMKAHRSMANDPSIVFAGMNMGVIIGACLIGIFLFNEKLSKWNYIGLVLALASIICMTIIQYGL
ncbi:MAG: EamA/RhaT family transporter [Pedobacter sp.]|nr:MAG: EamA/RhaT family transporter [Pedobacter sp.]